MLEQIANLFSQYVVAWNSLPQGSFGQTLLMFFTAFVFAAIFFAAVGIYRLLMSIPTIASALADRIRGLELTKYFDEEEDRRQKAKEERAEKRYLHRQTEKIKRLGSVED